MKEYKIAVAFLCVVLFAGPCGGVASGGATFTRQLAYPDEPWGPGEVFLLLGPRHGQVVGEVTADSGLVAGDYTQVYLSHILGVGDLLVPVEGPISVYTFDPDPANPPASYDPAGGDAFHLIVTGRSYTDDPPRGIVSHPKPDLVFPELDDLFNFDNAQLDEGLSWRPVITPSGGLDLLVVPEPGTFVLLLSGALALLLLLRRRKAAAMGDMLKHNLPG